MIFVEKVFRQKLIKHVAGEAWGPAETIRTVRRIKSASEPDLYNVLKYFSSASELNILTCLGGLYKIDYAPLWQ